MVFNHGSQFFWKKSIPNYKIGKSFAGLIIKTIDSLEVLKIIGTNSSF